MWNMVRGWDKFKISNIQSLNHDQEKVFCQMYFYYIEEVLSLMGIYAYLWYLSNIALLEKC